MQKEEQEYWNRMVDTHWWARGHYAIIKGLIKNYLILKNKTNIRCLDVGCSDGNIAGFLQGFGKVYGFDVIFDSLRDCLKKDYSVLQADAIKIPFKDETFDAVTLLDVSEHVDDDYALFSEVYRVCKSPAVIFVDVPAHKVLWGAHDIWNNHKRRYAKSNFKKLAQYCNFKIARITYLHPHLFLPLLLLRLSDRIGRKEIAKRHDFFSFGEFLDNILFQALIIENKLVKNINFAFGTSLFACLIKP